MIVGVHVESHGNERRVALIPALVPTLTKAGMEVMVESGAGQNAGFPDSVYKEHGASVVSDRHLLFSSADVLLQVHSFGQNHRDFGFLRSKQVLIGLLDPLGAPTTVQELARSGATTFALELLPRISRAQPMDALTSMATIGGYKAVLLAAGALGKMFPMMITAAGTLTPARVFVIGAGVAGLQAIATARRLGAIVVAYDVRPSVREQIESLGARFLEIELETKGAEASSGYAKAMGEDFYRRQRETMRQAVAESDVVIATAAIPGKKAPVLITQEIVQGMRPGSVIVDLAAESGGNCELTRPGEHIEENGVSILGPVNLPSTIPYHASQMYSRNVSAFLLNLVKDGEIRLDLEDQIIRDTLLTHNGEVVNPLVRQLLGLPEISTLSSHGST